MVKVRAWHVKAVSRLDTNLHERDVGELWIALKVDMAGGDARKAGSIIHLVQTWALVDKIEGLTILRSKEGPVLGALVEAIHLVIGVFVDLAVGVASADPKVALDHLIADGSTRHATWDR